VLPSPISVGYLFEDRDDAPSYGRVHPPLFFFVFFNLVPVSPGGTQYDDFARGDEVVWRGSPRGELCNGSLGTVLGVNAATGMVVVKYSTSVLPSKPRYLAKCSSQRAVGIPGRTLSLRADGDDAADDDKEGGSGNRGGDGASEDADAPPKTKAPRLKVMSRLVSLFRSKPSRSREASGNETGDAAFDFGGADGRF
jgi:hypothetical protein